jgi:hypothetical protein
LRTVVCLIAAALNALLAAALTGMTFDAGTPLALKAGFAFASLAAWLTVGALVAGPFVRLPAHAVTVLRAWCIALPVLYFLASLDRGILSGQEFLLGLVVAGFSWGTWRAFAWAKLPVQGARHSSASV